MTASSDFVKRYFQLYHEQEKVQVSVNNFSLIRRKSVYLIYWGIISCQDRSVFMSGVLFSTELPDGYIIWDYLNQKDLFKINYLKKKSVTVLMAQ